MTGEIMKKKESYDLIIDNNYSIDEIQTTDSKLTTIMQHSLDLRKKNVIEELYKSKEFAKLVKKSIPKKEYKLVLSGFQKNQIRDGSLKLMNRRDGGFYPELVDPKTNQVVKKIPIKESNVNSDSFQAMSNYRIQMQLVDISNQLKIISLNIAEVKQGQINDRLAKAYSTEEQLLEALVMTDKYNKKNALVNIAQSASLSRKELMLQQEESLKFFNNLSDSKLIDMFKNDSDLSILEIDKRIQNIKETFQVIHRVSIIQSLAYQENGEHDSARKGLMAYAKHVKETYFNNKDLIEQLRLNSDVNDDFWFKVLPQISEAISGLLNENLELPLQKANGNMCVKCGKHLGDSYKDKICPKCKRQRKDTAKNIYKSTKTATKIIGTVVGGAKLIKK